MKRILLLTITLLFAGMALSAAPAYPGKVVATQPDGTRITLRVYGDEFGHWVTNEAGSLMVCEADGFWRPAPSTISVSAIQNHALTRRMASNISRRAPGTQANFGSPRIPVLLIGFEGKPFLKRPEDFSAMLNQEGYSDNGAVGSVLDYFRENSFGKFTPSFEVFGPVQLSHPISYYGTNTREGDDIRPEMALVHAAYMLDDTVDFSQYDNDGDGIVDFILFYYAGYDEARGAPSESIWSHAWSVTASASGRDSCTFDGVRINDYFCTAELHGIRDSVLCRIGTTCHEFSHTLGLPDFYDSNGYSSGQAAETYYYDLMCEGCYNADSTCPPYLNAEELMEVGWYPTIPALPEGEVSLPEINHPGAEAYSAYRLESSERGEYFLFETRGGKRWDEPLPPGMVVYHVDRSSHKVTGYLTASQTWYVNQVNAYSSHPCCYVVPAGNPASTSYYRGAMANIPFPGSKGVTEYSPSDWNGNVPSLSLTDISYAAGVTTFRTSNPYTLAKTGYSCIDDPKKGSYVAGESLVLKLIEGEGERKPASDILWSFDGEPVTGTSVRLPAGTHLIEAGFTTRSGSRKTVSLEVEVR